MIITKSISQDILAGTPLNSEIFFKSSYGNLSGNLRWNHIFNDKLFSNLSVIYSKYDYDLTITLAEFDWVSSIDNYNIKYDLKYYANDKFKLDFGLSGIYYDFDPGQIKPTTSTIAYQRIFIRSKKSL